MGIEKQVVPYEILMRFDKDGFVGAHYGEIELIVEDGQVTHQKELPVRPITEIECAKFIGDQNAALIEAADTARAAELKSKRVLELANMRIAELQAQIEPPA